MSPNTAQPASLVLMVLGVGPMAWTGSVVTGWPAAFLTSAVSVPWPGCGATMLLMTTGFTAPPVIGDVTVEVMRRYSPLPDGIAQLMSLPVESSTAWALETIVYMTSPTLTRVDAGSSFARLLRSP